MNDEKARAIWQTEPCPPWCTQDHRDDDHPDDRYHDSAVTRVPVILIERDHAAGPGRWEREAGEITIVTSRHADTAEVVTFIGRDDGPGQQLTLTPEGAARLAAAIARHVAETGHDR